MRFSYISNDMGHKFNTIRNFGIVIVLTYMNW
ncbi:hypothetical protein M2273_005278 [Mucilaginibacter lappiensis]